MRPNTNTPCHHCAHPFGVHYQTFSGQGFGCSGKMSNRSDAAVCKCRGFAVLWTPNMESLVMLEPGDVVVSGTKALEGGDRT